MTSSAQGQLFGLFKSEYEEKVEANETWFAQQKQNIKLTDLNLGVRPFAGSDSSTGKRVSAEGIGFRCTIENLSDKKITALVMEITITNKENLREAAKGVRIIPVEVLTSQKLTLNGVFTKAELGGMPLKPDDDLYKAMKALKYDWSYTLRTVLTPDLRPADFVFLPEKSKKRFDHEYWSRVGGK